MTDPAPAAAAAAAYAAASAAASPAAAETQVPPPGALSVRGVRKHYQVSGQSVAVIEDFSLEFGDNEFTVIVGSSGCGKSTLLRIISGLITDYEGEVLLHGRSVTGPGRERGFVFQEPRLMPWLTVRDNILFGLRRTPDAERLLGEYLAMVGLGSFSQAYPAQLSGGMAQRCAIARALISQPEILLLDEPFGALDAMTKVFLQEELLRIRGSSRTTFIMVTHDIEEAVYLADRIVVMSPRPGRIRDVIEVRLPRPRNRSHADFVAIKQRIFNEFFTTQQLFDYNI